MVRTIPHTPSDEDDHGHGYEIESLHQQKDHDARCEVQAGRLENLQGGFAGALAHGFLGCFVIHALLRQAGRSYRCQRRVGVKTVRQTGQRRVMVFTSKRLIGCQRIVNGDRFHSDNPIRSSRCMSHERVKLDKKRAAGRRDYHAHREARKKVARLWKARNPEKNCATMRAWSKAHRAYHRDWRRRRLALLEPLKAGPCVDCGGTFPAVAMDFDHIEGRKVASVSGMARGNASWKRVLAEIAKCDLVCANCHRVRTARRGDSVPRRYRKKAAA